jgi:hypothetical protein
MRRDQRGVDNLDRVTAELADKGVLFLEVRPVELSMGRPMVDVPPISRIVLLVCGIRTQQRRGSCFLSSCFLRQVAVFIRRPSLNDFGALQNASHSRRIGMMAYMYYTSLSNTC